jgi:hypothetical protein
MAPEAISTKYFINPYHQSVCLHVYLSTVARQRLDKIVAAAANTHATTKEVFDASFYMRSVPYPREADD